MQYVVTKQIAVDAESPEEAVGKASTEGKVIALNCSPRPQMIQPQVPVPPASKT